LKTNVHPFHSASRNFSKSLFVNASTSLFRLTFEVLQAFWVIAVASFVEKSAPTEVKWREVCGSWSRKTTPDKPNAQEVAQASRCCVRSVGGRPILLEPAILFTAF
jgi:hypothetical protein